MADLSGNGHSPTALSHRQRRAIPHLVGAPSYERGCKQAGIGRRTLTDWLSQPEFVRSLRDAETRAYREALAEIQRSVSRAARTLRRLLTSANEAVRLRAASELLAYAMKSREQGEIEDRLAAIEARIKETPHSTGRTMP